MNEVKFTEAAFLIEDLIKLCKQQHEALKSLADSDTPEIGYDTLQSALKAIEQFNKLFK